MQSAEKNAQGTGSWDIMELTGVCLVGGQGNISFTYLSIIEGIATKEKEPKIVMTQLAWTSATPFMHGSFS